MKFARVSIAAWAVGVAVSASAAPSADEVKQLGTTLTPWGAEKAGNKEGTIPEYTGGVKNPPKVDPATGIFPDPYADDKVVFKIDAKNMDKYADKLSPGVQAMMKKYPTFRLDVYPTRRSVNYPSSVAESSIKNATRCSTTNGGEALDTSKGCRDGIPFPIPKNGYEVMWNRNASYLGVANLITASNWFVKPSGDAVLAGKVVFYYQNGLYDPNEAKPDRHLMWRGEYVGPTRLVGQTTVMYDTVSNERKSWSYQPSTRRTRLAPDLAADTPIASVGGSMLYDEAEMFSGALDRYNFKLVGKKEMYIPYNNYRTGMQECRGEGGKAFMALHPNPDCVRWELHRVWHVHATLKEGKRHVYKERDFFFDEDAWMGGIVDEYDHSGQIYRVTLAALRPDYKNNAPAAYPDLFTIDMNSGTWGWINRYAHWMLDKPMKEAMSPESLQNHMLVIPKS